MVFVKHHFCGSALMRRQAFLNLTGLSPDKHKNLVRNDLLPYAEDEDAPAQGWGYYTLRQAIFVLLAIELANAGLDKRTACAVVAELNISAPSFQLATLAEQPDIWVGAIAFTQSTNRGLLHRYAGTVGTLSKISLSIVQTDITVKDIEKQSSSIILVNFSRVLRIIKARAEQFGISIDFDGLWDPNKTTEPNRKNRAEP